MPEQQSEIGIIFGFIRRQWLIVGAAVLVGVVAALAWAVASAPEPLFTSNVRVRVATGLTGANVPTIDSVISSVSSPEVKQSVAASLGVEASKVPAASAAVDGKNTLVALITVRHPSKQTAMDTAVAYAEAVRRKALAQVDPNIEYHRKVIETQSARMPSAEARLELTQRLLERPGLSVEQQAALIDAASSAQAQLLASVDKADASSQQIALIERYVYLDGTAVSAQGSAAGTFISFALRGLLMGLMVGVLVAIAREMLGTRRRTRSV